MNATATNGDIWTGERHRDDGKLFWLYRDAAGQVYESTEVPAYRIHLENAVLAEAGGRLAIQPRNPKPPQPNEPAQPELL